MSSKSLDPISRRSKKASSTKASPAIPRTADTAKVLEKAQAALEARKEGRAKKNRKLIFATLVVALVVFLMGGGLISWQAFQKDSQQKKQDQAKQSVISELEKFDPVSGYSDADKDKLYEKVGAEYAAAKKLGIGLDPNSPNDKTLLRFMTIQKQDADSVTEAIKKLVNLRLEIAKTDGYYKGYIFFYWFGNSVVNKLPEEKIDGWGDPNVLASDRAYADSRIKDDRQKLIDNKISPNEIIAEVKKDNRLQLHDNINASSSYESNLMDTEMTPRDGRFESVDRLLGQYTKPGITEIGVISADPGYPASGKKKDVGYVFLKLDVALKGPNVVTEYENEVKLVKEKVGL